MKRYYVQQSRDYPADLISIDAEGYTEERQYCDDDEFYLASEIQAELVPLLKRILTHPAGSWMSAALSELDTATCAECKRDFRAWFKLLEVFSSMINDLEETPIPVSKVEDIPNRFAPW